MIVKNDQDLFLDLLEDSSGLSGANAREVFFPESEEDACAVMRQAQKNKEPMTISGAGTGVVGGRLAFGGAILSTQYLNRIIEIEKFPDAGGAALVEPGVSLNELQAAANKQGLSYLVDPTEKNAFLGGTIATNASGASGFKFGSTRNFISGLRVVLPQGEVLEMQRGEQILRKREGFFALKTLNRKTILIPAPNYQLPRVKNAAGYYLAQNSDAVDLFIGQEGTLGLISRAWVRLSRSPRMILCGLVYFKTDEAAWDLVQELKRVSYQTRREPDPRQVDSAAIEYFDENTLELLKEKYPRIPVGKTAAVYFEQLVFDENEDAIMETYLRLMEKRGIDPAEVWFAVAPQDREALTQMRYEAPVLVNERVKKNGFSKISTDISVSDEKFPELFGFYKSCLKEQEIPYCIFGHAGENHLHVNLMPERKEDFVRAKSVYREFVALAVRLGGSIAAEHGIGKLKRDYFRAMVGDAALAEMIAVKRSLDPNFVLGRGNIFPAPGDLV